MYFFIFLCSFFHRKNKFFNIKSVLKILGVHHYKVSKTVSLGFPNIFKLFLVMNYWLVKSEPTKYSWSQFLIDKKTMWDGVRNYAARNNLRAMAVGDLVFYYHSNEGLEIVGIAEVVTAAYQDPTTPDTNWVVVDLQPYKTLPQPVSLLTLKADQAFENMDLIRLGRLSVGKVTNDEFEKIVAMSGLVL